MKRPARPSPAFFQGVAASVLLILLSAVPAAAQKFQALGEIATSPNLFSLSVNVSGDGRTVVGYTENINGAQREAFRWQDSTFQSLGFLRDELKSSSAVAASADGDIVVGSSQNGGPDLGGFPSDGGFVWQNGSMTELPRPSGLTGGSVNGISDDGNTLVATAVKYDLFEGYERQVYFYSNSTITPIAMPPGLPYGYAIDISPDGNSAIGATSLGFGEPQTGWIYDGTMKTLSEPDGYRNVIPTALSAAGVVVGSGILEADNTYRPIRWTSPGSATALPVPGASGGRAHGVSNDGLIVVGESINSFAVGDHRAYVWDLEESTTPRPLSEILEELGEDMSGWTLHSATGVSGDGGIVVGYASDSTGKVQAYRANIGRAFMRFATPAANEIVEPGDTYNVRFTTEEGVTAADIYFVGTTDPNGPRVLVQNDVNLESGLWEWEVPASLGSPSSFLIAVNVDDTTQEARTSRFRVREKWRLHRVVGTVAEPQYEPVTDDHFWKFDQSEENVWPRSYWDQPTNAYEDLVNGYDPFIEPFQEVRYDIEYFGGKRPDDHPTWTSWVDAFGIEATYTSTTPLNFEMVQFARVNPDGVGIWDMATGQDFLEPGEGYGGICYGLSMAALLAFGHEDEFRDRWIPGRQSEVVGAMDPTEDVLRAIHALYNYQFSVEQLAASLRNTSNGITPRTVLERIKRMFERDTRDLDQFIIFFSEYNFGASSGFGGHAVVPLLMERTEEDLHVIDVYDPNYGFEPTQIYVDSTNNSWWTADDSWVGDTGRGLYTSVDVTKALEPATAPWAYLFSDGSVASQSIATATAPGQAASDSEQLRVIAIGGDSGVRTASGEVSFRNGTLTKETADAYAEFPITGGPSRPTAYRVPSDDFVVDIASGVRGHSSVRVAASRGGLHFDRAWRTVGTVDSVLYSGNSGNSGGALSVVAGDSGYINLGSQLVVGQGDDTGIRYMDAKGMMVAPESETSVSVVSDSSALQITGSTETTYNLSVGRTTAGESYRFYAARVALRAGAIHTVRPEWDGTLDSVRVEIDSDGDGSVDETIVLADEGQPVTIDGTYDAAALDQSGLDLELRVYPNPVGSVLSIDVIGPGIQSAPRSPDPYLVTVYDALGRRVQSGYHEATINLYVHGLPSGVYFVRVEGNGQTATGKFLVAR